MSNLPTYFSHQHNSTFTNHSLTAAQVVTKKNLQTLYPEGFVSGDSRMSDGRCILWLTVGIDCPMEWIVTSDGQYTVKA